LVKRKGERRVLLYNTYERENKIIWVF
jgi:hypothetical protein